MMKVYCKDCKSIIYQCKRSYITCKKFNQITIKDSYLKPNKKLTTILCSNINNNNDCPDYQPHLFKRFRNWLRSKFKGNNNESILPKL